MLPVTHVLAFGECQRLWGFPEGNRTCPDTSQRCYTAASLAGAWLVAQSEATPSAPTISIFQKPPGVIPPGGSTTICCTCQRSYGSFVLYRGGHQLHTLEQSGSRAEFSISNVTYNDSGIYVCHYLEGGTVLARSNELEVVVNGEGCAVSVLWVHVPQGHTGIYGATWLLCPHDGQGFSLLPWFGEVGTIFTSAEPVGGFTEILVLLAPCQSPLHLLIPSPVPTELRLPRPDLSVLPGHKVTAGADVMFRCTSAHPSTGCFLYLEGQTRAQLLSKEQGDYNLSHVQKGDSGRYSCQCYTMNASRDWSAVSNTLDLVVRDYTLCNTVRLALAAGLLLLLGLITAEAARSRCCRGWRGAPLPAGSAAPPGLFPSSNPRCDK
ncbi:osteoclast-associated immunoglobulin-like receptor isoform 2-T4 [Sylvia borin]